jgi:uncharacterized protein YcfJ
MAAIVGSALDKIRRENDDAAYERETENAQRLREATLEWVTHLREPSSPFAHAPASTSTPSFRIGEVKDFPFVTEKPDNQGSTGQLSPEATSKMMDILKDASGKTDPVSRDTTTQRAAHVVAKDWLRQHLHHGHPEGESARLLHEMRAQAAFSGRELGRKLGLDPVTSTALGYSLERALEKEGFRVIASHSIDRIADVFKPSTASVAGATGMRAAMEANVSKSMTWLAEHGVTRELLKDGITKHAGKFTAMVEVLQHPDAIRRVAELIAHTPGLLHALEKMPTDREFRHAVGTLAIAGGEQVAGVVPGLGRAVGGAAIVTGSLLRGDTAGETGRHIFKAAMSIAGGALGGIAGGAAGSMVAPGVGTAVGGVVGASVGATYADKLSDKMLEAFDSFERMVHIHDAVDKSREAPVSKADFDKSLGVVESRAERGAEAALKDGKLEGLAREKLADAGKDLGFGGGGKDDAALERQMERTFKMKPGGQS